MTMVYKCCLPTCANIVALKRCGQCKAARYCDSVCQKADWIRHRAACTTMGAEEDKGEIKADEELLYSHLTEIHQQWSYHRANVGHGVLMVTPKWAFATILKGKHASKVLAEGKWSTIDDIPRDKLHFYYAPIAQFGLDPRMAHLINWVNDSSTLDHCFVGIASGPNQEMTFFRFHTSTSKTIPSKEVFLRNVHRPC